jgi:hypothetical protein
VFASVTVTKVCVNSVYQNLGCRTITLSGLPNPYTPASFIFGENLVPVGGQFKACATNVATNAYRCTTGSNSPAKLPEYVSVTVPSGTQSSPKTDFTVACNLVAVALYNPCSTYVNPDGTFTKEGKRAFDCIKSGFSLGLGGLLLSGGNVPAVTFALGILAGPTGCGNVVHLELAGGLLDLGKLNTLKSALGI